MTIPHSNIALYGFMGSGKSTIGQKLSVHLNIPFIDLDRYIEEQHGVVISEVFAEHGEVFFRTLESKAIESIISKVQIPHILSLGGGTLLNEDTADSLLTSYQILTLIVPFSILEDRIISSKRPLRAQARRLYEERREHYQNSGIVIPILNMSIDESVSAVVEVLHAA
jgi:shikimate kinase